MGPEGLIKALKKLGAAEIKGRGKGSHTWLEVADDEGQRIAIFNVPVTRERLGKGLFLSLLRNNKIGDGEDLDRLLTADDPRAEYLKRFTAEEGPSQYPGSSTQ